MIRSLALPNLHYPRLLAQLLALAVYTTGSPVCAEAGVKPCSDVVPAAPTCGGGENVLTWDGKRLLQKGHRKTRSGVRPSEVKQVEDRDEARILLSAFEGSPHRGSGETTNGKAADTAQLKAAVSFAQSFQTKLYYWRVQEAQGFAWGFLILLIGGVGFCACLFLGVIDTSSEDRQRFRSDEPRYSSKPSVRDLLVTRDVPPISTVSPAVNPVGISPANLSLVSRPLASTQQPQLLHRLSHHSFQADASHTGGRGDKNASSSGNPYALTTGGRGDMMESKRGIPHPLTTSFQQPGIETLCPQLVVPQDSECTLITTGLNPRTETGMITLYDARHNPVFQLVIERRQHQQLQRCLILTSPDKKTTFANACECSEATDARKAARLQLATFDADDNQYKHHGSLEQTSAWENGYIFKYTPKQFSAGSGANSCNAGRRICFQSTAAGERFEAKYEDGKLLAMLEPNSGAILDPSRGSLSIIVGPAVDAGLMVLCLLGSNWLR